MKSLHLPGLPMKDVVLRAHICRVLPCTVLSRSPDCYHNHSQSLCFLLGSISTPKRDLNTSLTDPSGN